MSGWQSIETAPKDGTPVDLWAKTWLPACDRFMFQRFPNMCWQKYRSVMDELPNGRTSDWGAGWTTHKGMWVGMEKACHLPREYFATHWMPLPEPPSALAEGKRT